MILIGENDLSKVNQAMSFIGFLMYVKIYERPAR